MSTWLNDAWESFRSTVGNLDAGSVLSFLGQKLFEGLFQAVAVVVIGWLVLYRQWRQLTQGRSDQVVFSANLLTPLDDQGRPSRRRQALRASAPDGPAAQDDRPAAGQRGASPA